MSTLLLDTCVIIDALSGKRSRNEFLQELVENGNLLACCPVNVAEVYAGLRPREESATERLLQSLEYYPIAWPVARLAGLEKRDYARQGVTLAMSDVTIAAVALYHGLALLTDHVKHFPLKDLTIYPLPGAKRQ